MGTLPHIYKSLQILKRRQNLGSYTEILFVDLKSAFDSVDHNILSTIIREDAYLPSWVKNFVYKIYGNSFITPVIQSNDGFQELYVRVNRGVL
jgi:hypothetical protein